MSKKSNHQSWTFFALSRIFVIYIVREEMRVFTHVVLVISQYRCCIMRPSIKRNDH